MANVFSEEAKRQILGDAFGEHGSQQPTVERVVSEYRKTVGFDFLDQMLYVYTKQWLPDDLLLKADKMTMAHSLELRVPFLDHRFVEFAASLPVGLKIRRDEDGGYTTKYLLRKAFEGKIPPEILTRKKMGFPVPLAGLWVGGLAVRARDLFASRSFRESGLFNLRQVSALVNGGGGPNGANVPEQAWSLLVLGTWLELFRVHP
jgi:asparagine synthase (glutamine-hydrolysing)